MLAINSSILVFHGINRYCLCFFLFDSTLLKMSDIVTFFGCSDCLLGSMRNGRRVFCLVCIVFAIVLYEMIEMFNTPIHQDREVERVKPDQCPEMFSFEDILHQYTHSIQSNGCSVIAMKAQLTIMVMMIKALNNV